MKKIAAVEAMGLLLILVVAACTAPVPSQLTENQPASIQDSLQLTVYKSPT